MFSSAAREPSFARDSRMATALGEMPRTSQFLWPSAPPARAGRPGDKSTAWRDGRGESGTPVLGDRVTLGIGAPPVHCSLNSTSMGLPAARATCVMARLVAIRAANVRMTIPPGTRQRLPDSDIDVLHEVLDRGRPPSSRR